MRAVNIALALMAGVTGLMAAWQWYRASLVSIDPGWDLPGSGTPIEPIVPELRALDLQVATDQAFAQAGRLNAAAARWTAASVLLGAASAIAGALIG